MSKLDGKTLDIEEENIKKIKELFPEVDTDGKIDFEKLKQVLGQYVDDSEERYKFTWNGKGEALRISQTPSMGTLRPAPEEGESKNWDDTENLYIEGDNLEVLKLLQKSYFSKIKMIYIDPPYNTGNDFVYPDNYKDNIKNYKKITGQVDDEGNTTTTNPEYNGRYHTDWLNMMYPRLRLARNLITDDGGIFISIDYNEVHNLRKICDEIFGEENFQREIIWRIGWLSGYKTMAKNFIRNHDSILFYSKNNNNLNFNKKYIKNDQFKPVLKRSSNVNEKLSLLGLDGQKQKELIYFINHENRPERYPIEDTWNSNEYDDLNSIAIVSFSGEKVSKILDINQDFKGQKSVKMLNRVVESMTNEDDIVLDFFAGTGSTAHSVMELNAEDAGNRKYIMVQLPQLTDKKSEAYKAGYKNISEIGKERIRRAGDKVKSELEEKYEKASEEERKDMKKPEELDIGFKVFKLDSSNIKEWNPGKYDDIQLAIEDSSNPYVEGRTEEDVVYEMILKMGVDLTYPVEKHDVNGKTIYSIGYGLLMICLSDNIDLSIAEKMVEIKNKNNQKEFRAIFRDEGFNSDADKTNIKETLKSAGLVEESFITL